MSDDIQSKLDKLTRIEEANRARSKKHLDNIKAQGKRQISVILSDATIDELARIKAESMAAGKPLTYGDIITSAINRNINIDTNKTLEKNLKKVNTNVNRKSKDVIKRVKYDVNIDTKEFTSGNAPTDKEMYKSHLEKILKKIPPGQWQKEADKLNRRGIKTPNGLTWTNNNLRMACKRFKQ